MKYVICCVSVYKKCEIHKKSCFWLEYMTIMNQLLSGGNAEVKPAHVSTGLTQSLTVFTAVSTSKQLYQQCCQVGNVGLSYQRRYHKKKLGQTDFYGILTDGAKHRTFGLFDPTEDQIMVQICHTPGNITQQVTDQVRRHSIIFLFALMWKQKFELRVTKLQACQPSDRCQ